MDATAILIWIVIGVVAGWLASVVVGGGGLVRYLITGLIGAFVGGFLFRIAGIDMNLGNPYVTEVVVAAIGAIVVVLIARLLAR
ncbi:GlsB/YeaQ/YmgE family stress response membrane protein [Labrenzia sp. 011]|uniref:GlsB/YeaQ/YmgE family stress response membrane protein n=1 Tax=Labrenzia sp. 011 TaxID=2171494 RepID=UPI000D5255F0|nr:GlsB/YeaQ/YmgE family stress response membrane protein [Labrenzia sp. 011]PVB62744.1 GlsB/YeaQ/YmgE family stress response membrane protein [Labrenzia sp. 011]